MSSELCPVCKGRGWMPQHFYEPLNPYVTGPQDGKLPCRACGGRGVIVDQPNPNPPRKEHEHEQ